MKYRVEFHRRKRIRAGIHHLSGALLAAMLAGCAIDPTLGPFDTPPAQQQQPAAQGAEAATGVNEAAGATAAPSSPAPDAQPEKTPPEIVSLPPIQLLGMNQEEIVRHLGQPVFQRRDRSALLLRYREEGCILDLFLYPPAQGGGERAVNYVEARTPEGQRIEADPCVDSVRKSRIPS